MTGRELILYILQNNLEDEPVIKDGKLVGFLSINEAALIFNVGPASVKTWVELGLLDGVRIGDTIYIPATNRREIK